MSANVKDIKVARSKSVYGELGVSGLRKQGGVIYEEYLRELQGHRWQRVIKQMVCDATIGAILFAIDTLMRQVQWSVAPAAEDNEAMEVAEFVRGALLDDMSMNWPDTLSEILTCLPWGWSYFEVVYKLRGGESSDPQKASVFGDNRIGWRKWAIRSQDTLDRWEFDESGGIQGMWQRDMYSAVQAILIPIERALLFRTQQRKSNPEGVSMLRTAYESWYYRRNIARIEAIGIERDLAGLPVMYVDSAVLKAQGAEYLAYKQIVTNLRRDEQEGVLLPSDRDEQGNRFVELELLSTGGTRDFDTDKIINRYDHRIMAGVLADFIMLGSEGGSFALGKDKSALFLMAMGAYLDAVEGVINKHAIPRLCRLNGYKQELCPKFQHGRLDKVDLGPLGDYVSKLATAGMLLFPSADGRLENHLLELGGLPTTTGEQ